MNNIWHSLLQAYSLYSLLFRLRGHIGIYLMIIVIYTISRHTNDNAAALYHALLYARLCLTIR